MAPKNVPLSVRVSEDDASFLAGLRLDGASTPSDKVRALLADARRRAEGFHDYAECLAMAHEMVAPTMHRVKELENQSDIHSEPVGYLADWLPEVLAFFVTTFPDDGPENDLEQIRTLERGVADRMMRLVKVVLRLGITPECQAYDPTVISQRMGPALELAQLISRNQTGSQEDA